MSMSNLDKIRANGGSKVWVNSLFGRGEKGEKRNASKPKECKFLGSLLVNPVPDYNMLL